MQKNGQFVDDPEAREKIWKTAPRAVDQFGNKLIKIGHYWCAFDFNRFWQLAVDESEEEQYIIVVRVADGRFFSRTRSSIRRGKRYWRRRIESGWYIFVDPLIQQVYQ